MATVRPEDWRPQGIDDLEDRAWTALRETGRSVAITAGAGAGKTEILAQKAAYLLQTGICPSPRRILAISFKRDAAATLGDRVRLRVPEAQARRFVSLTCDAWTKGMLDQFRRALPALYVPPSDYGIALPDRDEIRSFLDRVGSRLNRDQFETLLAETAIPLGEQGLDDAVLATLRAYWSQQYGAVPGPMLTFPMINRLVEYVLRTNPRIREALRATYPFVFLDEFQDTTSAQFGLVTTAFDPIGTRVTTVGDVKQRIMGFAGAMPDGFATFRRLFDAREVTLLFNWRSHEELVAVQRVVASQIDPATEPVRARRAKSVDGAHCAIWSFPDRTAEIDAIAGWVASELAEGRLEPQRLAILVRFYANQVEGELRPAFEAHGIRLRNVARSVGGVAIQDLLTEELTILLLPLLRLGTSRHEPGAWTAALRTVGLVRAIRDDDERRLGHVMRDVEALAVALRRLMTDTPPDPALARDLVAMMLEGVGEASVRQATAAYHRETDFLRIRSGFTALLGECLAQASSWSDALDRFEGKGQVPLMTIHKSKGMEFHTMIFFGLDDRSWKGLHRGEAEELNSFFVALTRAEQRAFFTCCTQRGGPIGWLETLLGDAVPKVPGGP
ncbi:DNA helicase [Methylorubrum extorquens]|uniref:UvrD-helicase domain-containing protein n=1 Tax=Methylorubrum extorquens TaxID=408 RepID=UPI00117443D8|nr:ATP-dependent helicase [Methylorubrum extorquens]GEL44441.1 DNA helicase [Methylorubrum extorquens]